MECAQEGCLKCSLCDGDDGMVVGLLTVDFVVRCFDLTVLLGNPLMIIFFWAGWILKTKISNPLHGDCKPGFQPSEGQEEKEGWGPRC